jgi:GR25 family glycosyltransferase involved in LPS biosynthesis
MEGYNFYMISLDRCVERRKVMYELYDANHLYNVNAYDGKILETYDDIILPENYEKYGTPGEYGCSLSHIKAIKQAFDNGDQEAFIIEDDMHNIYSHLWEKTLKEVIAKKPEKAECIIFYTSNPAIIKIFEENPKKEYMICKWTWSTGCYYINRGGMRKIVRKYYKNGKIDFSHASCRHDVIADANVLYQQMRTYFYTRPTFIDCCEESNIHPNQIQVHKQNHNYVKNYFEKNINIDEYTHNI